MRNEICVASYSLRQQLGPICVTFCGPDGAKSPFSRDQPQLMSLLEFPATGIQFVFEDCNARS